MKLFVNVRSIFSLLLLTGLVVGLQACSGGGGSSTPKDAVATGYYNNTGQAAIDDDGVTGTTVATTLSDLEGMINGTRFMMVSDATGLFYDGTITSISVNDFAANVSVFKHGQPIAVPNATITGTITETSKITGTLVGAGAGNGTFTLQYATDNKETATLTRIDETNVAGQPWDSEIGDGTDKSSFRISATGTLISNQGNAIDGTFKSCNIDTGSFTPIAGTNLYTVTMTTTNCANAGGANPNLNLTYQGLAAIWSGNNDLTIGVTDGTNKAFSINGDFY